MSKICVKCGDESLNECSEHSFQRMKEFTYSWCQLGRYVEVHEKLASTVWSPQQIFCHPKCYSALTHSSNLKKLKTAVENRLKNSNTRKSYDFSLCFVCQHASNGKVSTVSTNKVAQDILDLKNSGSEVKDKLSAFMEVSAILNGKIKYHSNCLITEKRKFLIAPAIEMEDKYAGINVEFLKHVKLQLTSLDEESPSVDMKELVEQYETLLTTANLPLPVATIRRYLKSLLEADEELMSKVDFYHFEPCKPTVIANKSLVCKLVCENHFQKESNETEIKVIKDIRQELSSVKEWEFNGSFSRYETPTKLIQFVKHILAGSYTLNERKEAEVGVVAKNIAQYICSNFKSNRQLTYQSSKERGFEKHRLTPLSVGTAIVNYQANRSRCEVENLSRIGLCINYDKLERIVTAIAVSLMKEASSNGLGIVLPPSIKKGVRPVFAADNIDFGSDSGSFHGADLMIVQRDEENRESLFPDFNFQSKSQERSLSSSITPQIDENVQLTDENNTTYESAISVSNAPQYWLEFQKLNTVWLLLSSLWMTPAKDGNHNTFSWSSFHSALSVSPNVLSNVAIVAPLYRRSPTEVPVLIDILKRAMNISVLTVGPGKRTIITFDGDLYKMAVKVPNYKENWIIRLGSLHTVIAALKCIGKYIEGSGIDTAWETCGLYGSVTVNQIIEGRHIYRGIHAHTVTIMALHSLYAQSILSDDDQQTIREIYTVLSSSENNFGIDAHNVKQKLLDAGILDKLTMIASPDSLTAVFLCNYMRQVANLLNYIGATRLRNWMQHLATTDDMVKYFHAHDQSNYAKWALLYLADMLELQTTDPESWKFLEDGNFAVSKNDVPFTSIDPDHAIEHEHRPMKTKGGFVNITGKESALDRWVLTLPILAQISEEYKRYSSIKCKGERASIHHELYGSFYANQLSSSQKLIDQLSTEGNPFNYPDLRSLMNCYVPSDSICEHILQRDDLGEKSVEVFRKERMMKDSTIGFWTHRGRNNFKMFSDKEILIPKAKAAITTLKEEKLLYSRMLLISRTRPELCPEKVIGEYELTNIPPSNFMPDGSMIVSKSNEALINVINEIQGQTTSIQNHPLDGETAIIIDGMDILTQLHSIKPMDNVGHLVNAFMSKFTSEVNSATINYSEARLVFPRFAPNSLSESRLKFSALKKVNVRYHVSEKTPIKKLETFLTNIDTRAELMEYLGERVLHSFDVSKITIVVGYGNRLYSNSSGHHSDILNQNHNLEDTTQLILLNAIDLKNNGTQNLLVKSMCTDTVVVLLGHKNKIPNKTRVIRAGQTIEMDDVYMRMGDKLSDAFIGWYAMQVKECIVNIGMENQGAFFGKGIRSHFKALQKSDDHILEAFTNFGKTETVTGEIITQMQRYICLLYANSCEKSIQDIRFSMSAVNGKEGKNLPPTIGTLIPHLYRAFYSALLSKLATTLFPEIPPPTQYYWSHSVTDNIFQPIMCINDPLPAELLDFKKCNCKASTKRCAKQSCTCVKSGLKCTELCGCGDLCENMSVDEVLWEEGEEEMCGYGYLQ